MTIFNLNAPFSSSSLSASPCTSQDDRAGSAITLGFPTECSPSPRISSDPNLTGASPSRPQSYPQNTTSASHTKRVRNRNTVRIDCKPCKRIFTRICIYRAHVKTRKHAVNLALLNAGASLDQVTSAPPSFDWSSHFPASASDDPRLPTSTIVNSPTEANSDLVDFDFSNFDWSTLSDYSSLDSESQASITPLAEWNALHEIPVEATLSIVGSSGSVIKGFYYPSTNLFIPS